MPENFDIQNIISKIKSEVNAKSDHDHYIPSIIEFCESKYYLNLPGSDINLFPMQKIILKSFYRGQIGNEDLHLTKEEIQLLYDNKLDGVLEKYHSDEIFRELILVLGRRSGKDFLTALIALYETMKLLEVPGGSPFKYYNMATGNPAYIVTVATAARQARILFDEMKARIYESTYFQDHMPIIDSDCMWFMTPEDKEIKQKLINDGLEGSAEKYKGSVVVMSGHSNSDSLLGKRYWTLLFDEVASYKTSGGAASGERLYSALGPGTSDFTRVVGYDEEGKPIKQTDSKIISISSPRSEQGILFKLYNDTPETEGRLSFKLPTWKVNIKYDENSLRKEHKYMTPNEFNMEFGAQFSGTAGEKFIPDQYVDDAIEIGTQLGLDQREVGVQGIAYYLHLDPAATSNNYALVMMHVEERIREKENTVTGRRETEKYKLFVVDHIKIWQPQMGKAIDVYEVDKYVIELHKRFRLALVTYDTFNYLASVQRMRAKGIPTKVTPFRKQYKIQIYQHLYNLLVAHQVALPRRGPYANLLEMELKCLKRIYTNNGFKICPDEEAQVKTDDVVDALAGACGVACEDIFAGYPKSVTVNTAHKGASQQSWQIGQGSYTDPQWRHYARKFGW